jgi:hypothetical protein
VQRAAGSPKANRSKRRARSEGRQEREEVDEERDRHAK